MSEKLTKLERAKRTTLDKLERIIRVIIGSPPDTLRCLEARRMFRDERTCGFCGEYRRAEMYCTACPIFLTEGRACYYVESYTNMRRKLNDSHPDTVTDLLAVMVYVHQLEAPDDQQA